MGQSINSYIQKNRVSHTKWMANYVMKPFKVKIFIIMSCLQRHGRSMFGKTYQKARPTGLFEMDK